MTQSGEIGFAIVHYQDTDTVKVSFLGFLRGRLGSGS